MSAAVFLEQLESGQWFVAEHQHAVRSSAALFTDRFWVAEGGDPDEALIEKRAAEMLASVETAYRRRDENLGMHSEAFVRLIVQTAAHALWKRLYLLRENNRINQRNQRRAA